MRRTQIQFPDPLYDRLKEVALQNDWPLAEVVRRAAELYVNRFPSRNDEATDWEFPVIDAGGDFLRDPKSASTEAEAIEGRS